VGCRGSLALAAAAVDGVVVAGPTAVWWLLGYSRRGISPILGDSACAAVRGCVLGYSQWGISLPLAAYIHDSGPRLVLDRAALPLQRQRSQNLTSASGDAIWGAHRPNYTHGQFGGICFATQVPPGPRCTPLAISTKLTPRLSPAPCCAGQPSFGDSNAAPRRALLPLDRK
jgi:hypothetical protein